jgi:outer membrane protein TolC
MSHRMLNAEIIFPFLWFEKNTQEFMAAKAALPSPFHFMRSFCGRMEKGGERFICALVMVVMFSILLPPHSDAQERLPLTLRAAVDLGVENFPAVKAKQNYLRAAQALTRNARNENLPNVIASAQQNYGTVNGQFGPMAAVGAQGVSSAGPAYSEQSWNAGFGAAYIISTNWEVFTFGRVRSRIGLSEAGAKREFADLEQEQFIHRVRISAAYLDLLIAQQLVVNSQSNLARVKTIEQSVKARTLSGLNPGVDSSLVNAEVSRAKLSLIDFVNNAQALQQRLAGLLNITAGTDILPDTSFFMTLPAILQSQGDPGQNPQLKFYRARVEYANELSEAFRKSIMPGLNIFGIFQARASGFTNVYNPETATGYSDRYSDGINPSRYNYVTGVSLNWNLLSPLKIRQQVQSQRFVAAGYQDEYDQLNLELQNQLILADQRMQNSLASAQEVPIQYKAASDAYVQKNVLYKNGLTTIVDLQQALYALNRAEIDKSVAYINVWHALLLKAAASGDFDLFINQVR